MSVTCWVKIALCLARLDYALALTPVAEELLPACRPAVCRPVLAIGQRGEGGRGAEKRAGEVAGRRVLLLPGKERREAVVLSDQFGGFAACHWHSIRRPFPLGLLPFLPSFPSNLQHMEDTAAYPSDHVTNGGFTGREVT